MLLAAANLLLRAPHADRPQQAGAQAWLEGCLNGDEPLVLSWPVILAVVRPSTVSRLFPAALTVDQALGGAEGWLQHPGVVLPQPGPEHRGIPAGLLRDAGRADMLTPDAHLAAPAIEHDAQLPSCAAEFHPVSGPRCRNPLA